MHPYTTKFGPFFQPANQDDVTIGVLSRLVKALDRAASAGALPRRLPIYVSEFGVQSYPTASPACRCRRSRTSARSASAWRGATRA